ncbi:MAG: rRNA pseudouridine synthase [Treponemataceae bacterium]|nr:rRNA pseudouridine synthase [Treponemataceae bacterium]
MNSKERKDIERWEIPEQGVRLQLYLARCGVASRRKAEQLIQEGRVTVNYIPITTMGVKVVPGDIVMVDGRGVYPEKRRHYLALHKPPGYLCSARDPYHRPLVGDLIPSSITERLFTIGRLDFRSSGLLILTNDGPFAAAIGHPSAEIEKEYYVESTVPIPPALIEQFPEGIDIEGITYTCRSIEKLGNKALRIVLIEGKNREIRRVFSFFHLHPRVLRRIRIGPVLLGHLAEGKVRPLTPQEIGALRAAVEERGKASQ